MNDPIPMTIPDATTSATASHGTELSVSGLVYCADASGALYWPGQQTVIIADPPLYPEDEWTTPREVLIRLAQVIDHYQPQRVVVLSNCRGFRLDHDDLAALHILQEDRQWLWITGTDAKPVHASARTTTIAQLGGQCLTALSLGGMHLVQRPTPHLVTHEIAGGMQPAARISTFGHTVRRPCFVGNKRRLLLPVFSAEAGGTNVLADAFSPLFGGDGLSVWTLGQDRPNPVASRKLAAEEPL